MNQPVKIYFVRHGETAWSLTGQHTGHSDIALTEHGEQEARELGPQLHDVAFDSVLVSPRLRAQQTCDLAGYGPRAKTEPDLVEWDYGDYEGQRSVDICLARPGWNVWRDGSPGGETPADVATRIDRLITRLDSMHGNVLLFAHGQFGASLAARWLGLPVSFGAHFALNPASLSRLGYDAAHPNIRVIALWNSLPRSRSDESLQCA